MPAITTKANVRWWRRSPLCHQTSQLTTINTYLSYRAW